MITGLGIHRQISSSTAFAIAVAQGRRFHMLEDMDDRFELPRVLTVHLADRLGVSRARARTEIRRGNWRRICRGALLTRPDDPTRADLAAVGIWLGGASAAMSGWDGLRTVGLGNRNPSCAPVLVLSTQSDNRSVDGLIVRRTFRPYSSWITPSGAEPYSLTPTVRIARAVVDAARMYDSASPVRAFVTASVQRRLCTPAELLAEFRTAPRAQSLLLRSALEDMLDGARSIAEATAASKLTHPGIPPFELNVEFINSQGLVLYSPDIYWRELRAILEVDSREYHFDEVNWKATMRRGNRLTHLGFAVTHYPPSVITSRDETWLDEVRDWLARRARELGTRIPAGRGPRRIQVPVIV